MFTKAYCLFGLFACSVFEVVAELLPKSPQVELNLSWSLALLQHHGDLCQVLGSGMSACLRAIQKSIVSHNEALGRL